MTGDLDVRFVLWRKFCADQGIAIDSLPGDLPQRNNSLRKKFLAPTCVCGSLDQNIQHVTILSN
jgi:hypothetical protein